MKPSGVGRERRRNDMGTGLNSSLISSASWAII
jgi:hypothetical protein